MNKIFKILSTTLPIFLISCSNTEKPNYNNMDDKAIFHKAITKIKKEEYLNASNTLQNIEYNYPYSELMANSWYISGYSYYKAKKYFDAVEQFEKLLKFYPTHKEADYVMYMIAICYYDQISPINRDQKITSIALNKMKKLVEKFPNSKYANDVKPKILIALNNIAAKEMFTAKTLADKKNIIGALNRYQTVIKKYDTSLFTPEAIFRTIEIYNMMDEKQDAENMLKLLETNYPKTRWYKLGKNLLNNK